jgi:hypothetical protein
VEVIEDGVTGAELWSARVESREGRAEGSTEGIGKVFSSCVLGAGGMTSSSPWICKVYTPESAGYMVG